MAIVRKKVTFAALFVAHATMAMTTARADDGPPPTPRHRLSWDNLIGARLNPLGLEDQFSIAYRARLYSHGSKILRSNHVGVTFSPSLSPANTRLGGALELKPASVFTLRASFYFIDYFGSFGSVQSFASHYDNTSDTALKQGKELGLNYSTSGYELTLHASAAVKFGPVAVQSEFAAQCMKLALRNGHPVFYNSSLDMVVPNGGWSLLSDTNVVYFTKVGLVAGIRGSMLHALYRAADRLPSEPPGNLNSPMWRAGPLVAYTFFDRPGARFNKPTIFAHAAWWLAQRYRTGDDVSQAIPYAVFGFRVEGDLVRVE